ncbi:MAG: PAS domain S-box protein [Chloroflexota bacterium]
MKPTVKPGNANPIEYEALSSAILTNLSDAIFLTDDSGGFVYVCPNVEILFGFSVDEVFALGNISNLLKGAPYDPQELSLRGVLNNRQFEIMDKSGKSHALLIDIKKVSIKEGTRLYTCRDVTDRKETEDALHRSEQLLRRVLDALPVGVWVADKDGHIVLSNPADQRIWMEGDEREPDEYGMQKAWFADTGQPLTPENRALVRAVRDGEITINETLEIESFDGIRKTILSSAAPIRDEHGVTVGGIAVNQDISEQRRMEIAERKHRTFANALSNITAVLTSSLNLETVMERILDHVGRVVPHEAANIMLIEEDHVRVAFWHNYGAKCDELFRTSRYSLDIPMLREMLQTGLPHLVGDTRSANDWVIVPETAWVRSSVGIPIRARDVIMGFLILDSSEPDFFKPPDAERLRAFAYQAAIAIENARLFSTVREYASELEMRVTQRTAELHSAKEHVEAILEHSSDGIALVTSEGRITQVNPSFMYMFGITDGATDIQTMTAYVDQDGWKRLASAFKPQPSNGDMNRIELICHRLDGKTFDADVAIAPLLDQSTGIYLYICNFRDVTQQKIAERELRLALVKEKELSELKSQFVAMVSHEFRTPLASIQTSTDLLYSYYNRLTAERRNEIILRIQSQIQQLTVLLGDVLTVAKADTVGLVLDLNIVDLRVLCTQVISELSYSIAKNREIEYESGGESLTLELDPKLFQQVLANLLSNALKYSQEGTTVKLEIVDREDYAEIYVHDEGIGIPQEDLARLFDAFHRARNVGERQGTGLGLAVVKRAVEAHHGTVEVQSELRVGTTFKVIIPKKQSATSTASMPSLDL